MMKKTIKIKEVRIQNFKGCKDRVVQFGDKTKIFGANATGKTTIFDAFTWLLFGKDSQGNAKFEIRPLDKSGNRIDHVEISVEATVLVGDDEYTFKKVQKQVWRKKRGTDTREFQGNVNEFEINGYPKSEKEFNDFISSIVHEEIFKLVTSADAFTSSPWKKQREILLKFIGESSDVQIAELYGEKYQLLIPELKIASTDDILAKYNKVKNKLNKQMVEIPARIDEISKQLVVEDVGALEIEKAAKDVELKKIVDQLEGGSQKLKEIDAIREKIFSLKMESSGILNSANEELNTARAEKRRLVYILESEVSKIKSCLSDEESAFERIKREIERTESEKSRLAEEWKALKSKKFKEYEPLNPLGESDMTCPTCGQELPADVKEKRIANYNEMCKKHREEYEKKKEEFEKQRSDDLALITEKGQAAADKVKEQKKLLREKFEKSHPLESELSEMKAKADVAKAELGKVPDVADVSCNERYLEIQKEIVALEKELEEKSSYDSERAELELRKNRVQEEIFEIDAKIKASDNAKVKERIAELEEEKSLVGQKIADQERMIDLTEDFIRAKMTSISNAINGKFQVVSFKLFDNQINGGLKETCECTVGGTPFSSLNNGHKIIAGLDIIRSLSELYGISCPVFIDNAESINEFNIPEMDCQTIQLIVYDDKHLHVEV